MSEENPPRRMSVAAVRRTIFGVLLAVAVAGFLTAGIQVAQLTVSGGPIARIKAAFSTDADPTDEREQLLGIARDFVASFNTYGPDLLDDDDTMPEYAALSDDMTAKFAEVFDANVGYAEQTVAELKIKRSANVYAVGIASSDDDSAELLVAGTVTFAYPNPKNEKKYIDYPPERFRYQVSLVKQHGEWLVDDLDDLDDDLSPLAESVPSDEQTSGQTPSATSSATPSATPSAGDGTSGATEAPSDGGSSGEEGSGQ